MTKKQFEAEYKKALSECKQIIATDKSKQMIIAGWAIKLCDFRHGLGKSDEMTINNPTIAQFAADLKINVRTLYEWIRARRKVWDQLPESKRQHVKYDVIHRAMKRIKAKDSPKAVQAIIDDELESPREHVRFRRYEGHLNAILYNAERPANLEFCDAEIIQRMIMKTQRINDLLRKYMDMRLQDKTQRQRRAKSNIYKNIVKQNQAAA
jgi:hypothetical protein